MVSSGRGRIIAITGTKGKTTTTSLVGQIALGPQKKSRSGDVAAPAKVGAAGALAPLWAPIATAIAG